MSASGSRTATSGQPQRTKKPAKLLDRVSKSLNFFLYCVVKKPLEGDDDVMFSSNVLLVYCIVWPNMYMLICCRNSKM